MMMNKNKVYPVLLLSLVLTGCGVALKSEYQPQTLSIPAQWQGLETGDGFLHQTTAWWEQFHDPQLSTLIETVLMRNPDLAIAGLKLEQARLSAGLSNTNRTPTTTLSGGASNTQNLHKETTPRESYNAGLTLSYELDLWGKLAREREQAAWQATASAEDRQNTARLLIGTTARYYWQISTLNGQITQQQAGVALRQHTLRLVQARYLAGDTDQLEVLQARQSLLDRENRMHVLVQQRAEARNALAILFDQPPGARQAERAALDTSQQVPIAAAQPVAVIARRPDVQAAEARLRAALAGSDVQRLSFYPSLSLSATLGAASTVFQQWFSNPARTLGATLTLPFIEWNKVQLTVERADLDVKQAAIIFRSQVYSALSDVDTALSQRLSAQQQKEAQYHGLQLNQQRRALAESQYRAGAVSLQTLLDSEDAVLASETGLSDLQYTYLSATMSLWLALGGGDETDNGMKGTQHD